MYFWGILGESYCPLCPLAMPVKDFTLSESGEQPVILRTLSLVVCLVYGIRKSSRRHQGEH